MRWGSFLVFLLFITPSHAQPTMQPNVRVESIHLWSQYGVVMSYEDGISVNNSTLPTDVYEVKISGITDQDVEYSILPNNENFTSRYTCIGDLFISPDWDYWAENLDQVCSQNAEINASTLDITYQQNDRNFSYTFESLINNELWQYERIRTYRPTGIADYTSEILNRTDIAANKSTITEFERNYLYETSNEEIAPLPFTPVVFGLAVLRRRSRR